MNELLYISVTLFFVYIAWMVQLFGIPESISETYYILERKRKGLGYIFMAWCLLIVATLAPYWFEHSRESLQFLVWFAALGLLFVGAAPTFRCGPKTTKKVHFGGAIVCAVASLAWTCFSGFWVYPLIIMPIFGFIAYKHPWSWLFWIETGAFISLYITLITN